jgi:hypothetical protein
MPRPIEDDDNDSDEEEYEDASDTGSIDAVNSQLEQYLKKKYGIEVIPDKRPLSYRPVYACVDTLDEKGVHLFAATSMGSEEGNGNRTVMIAAIVLEEYSLQGTSYPVTVQLKSAETPLLGTECTRTFSKWSAVLIPGMQHSICNKVMFEPPSRDIKLARKFYPDCTVDFARKEVQETKTNGVLSVKLSVYSEDDTPAKAECPLGYTLYKSGKLYPKSTLTENGKTRTYLILSQNEYERAFEQFCQDSMDARPKVPLSSIRAHVQLLDSGSLHRSAPSSFVLSMKIGIFCYYI